MELTGMPKTIRAEPKLIAHDMVKVQPMEYSHKNSNEMEKAKIKKEDLVAKIKSNKDKFVSAYEDAMEDYQEALKNKLLDMLDKANKGESVDHHIDLVKPEDHTSDYDYMLEMLDMTQDEVILLSEDEFRNYVMNQWHWVRSFTDTANMYFKMSGKPGITRELARL